MSLAFFISLESLPLRDSGSRLLERDIVLVNTPLGTFTSVHTQESSQRFLPRNGAWPSLAVKMSSSLVGDPPRDGSRGLYASRSSGSGESPLVNDSGFLCRWLRACERTSSVLAGESHDLPGVGGVVKRLLASLLAPLGAALRLPWFNLNIPRTGFDTLCPDADPLAAPKLPTSPLPLLHSTLLPLVLAPTRRDELEEKSGDYSESLYPRETLCALTLSGYFASSG